MIKTHGQVGHSIAKKVFPPSLTQAKALTGEGLNHSGIFMTPIKLEAHTSKLNVLMILSYA
jgi:hypothetical protein